MRTGRRFRGWVIAAAVGGGASALAQSPAARLLPVDPNNPAAIPVARSAYPDIPDAGAYRVPVQGYYGQPPPPSAPGRTRTWLGGAWSGVREFVVGRPTAAEMTAAPQPGYQTTPPLVAQEYAPPPQAESQPPAGRPQPEVYAGPPAYRWYGWGSTTPGANQYAPHGLYPKGSANWHQHTGATPGAFPVPIVYPPSSPGVEPPVYAGNPNGYDAAYRAASRTVRAEPEPSFDPRHPSAVPLGGTTVPGGQPVTSTPAVREPVAPTPEVNWQSVTPLPSSPGVPSALPPRSPQPADPQWVPVTTRTYPGTVVPVAATPSPLVRGQQSPEAAETPDVAARIRAACFSRVNQVRVTETGQGKLTVTIVTTTEQLAKEAAAVVSKLPEVRPYEVRFEVQLTK